jgi:hypothetical protein
VGRETGTSVAPSSGLETRTLLSEPRIRTGMSQATKVVLATVGISGLLVVVLIAQLALA